MIEPGSAIGRDSNLIVKSYLVHWTMERPDLVYFNVQNNFKPSHPVSADQNDEIVALLTTELTERDAIIDQLKLECERSEAAIGQLRSDLQHAESELKARQLLPAEKVW